MKESQDDFVTQDLIAQWENLRSPDQRNSEVVAGLLSLYEDRRSVRLTQTQEAAFYAELAKRGCQLVTRETRRSLAGCLFRDFVTEDPN